MKVMVIVKASPSSEAGALPRGELLNAMVEFNQRLADAGIIEAGDGLKPSSEGFRVRFSGSRRTVTAGPFAETNELIAGYWVWNVASIDEALDWVKKCPNPMEEDSDIEVRPFFELEDFAGIEGSETALEEERALRETISLRQTTVNTYLFFGGDGEEALEYYKKHLGTRVQMLLRFKDSPEPIPPGMIPDNFGDKIMHAEFNVGDARMFASDGCAEDEKPGGFSIALTLPQEDDARRVFAALADGGNVVMPLEPTFWSPLFGQVTDRFGIGWMIMLPGDEDMPGDSS